MKADPFVQLRLLELQTLDANLDRLAHRRRSLPELAELQRLDERLKALRSEIVNAETEDSDLEREQSKIEGDVDVVRSRTERDRQRLDGGLVSSPKELENLQSEVASLGRRQADLEEQVLEVMERREAVESRLAALRAERDMLDTERAAVEERRDVAFSEIDGSTARQTQERAEMAASLPADLLGLYEKIRADRAGVGAAALLRGRCEGCHLSVAGQDLAHIRVAPADDVLRCEECRRILVRTAESGL